jgi:hypothetical protein
MNAAKEKTFLPIVVRALDSSPNFCQSDFKKTN